LVRKANAVDEETRWTSWLYHNPWSLLSCIGG